MTRDHGQDAHYDDLLQRMQQADPARERTVPESEIAGLRAAAIVGSAAPRARDRRWAPGLVAAAAVALIAGAAYATTRDSDPPTHAPSPPTTASLTLPGSDSGPTMQSCVPFGVRYLRDMPTALSGTATRVDDGNVTIAVDHWYRGGDADLVELVAVDPQTAALLNDIEFVERERYLIAATDGTVNLCGFSGPWSEALAAAYAEAFGE